jgi:anthranilate phosphoribosyltransferase
MKDFDFKNSLISLMKGQCLKVEEAELAMLAILNGELQAEQTGAFLTAFHFRPPVADEFTGFVKALRTQSQTFTLKGSEDLLDVCGTGGDGMGTFNVSTAVAFVAAAAGQKVAKHGNRAVSSRCGSFDVLEALGVPYANQFQTATELLETFNLSFLYAPAFYPVMQKLAPVRRNLGFRTLFNALGPLLNPLSVGRQLMGVYSQQLLVPIAETFRNFGAKEVMIVRAEDGTDELSLASPSLVIHLKNQEIKTEKICPEDYSLYAPNSAVAGGDAIENARLLISVLRGEPGPYRDITVFNTAAALLVGGKALSIKEGLEIARAAIDSGRANSLIEKMQTYKVRMLA